MLEVFHHPCVPRENLGDLKVTFLRNGLNIIPKILYNLEPAPQPPAEIKGIPEKKIKHHAFLGAEPLAVMNQSTTLLSARYKLT